jgi:fumarate hydratase class I
LNLSRGIVELYRKVATSLPPDVEKALKEALKHESGQAREALDKVLQNISIARNSERPICQDTGIPIFFVKAPQSIGQEELKKVLFGATRKATEEIPLRPNAVNPLSGENSGDNTGRDFPLVYIEQTRDSTLVIDLLLKGGGSENVSALYKLPDEELNAPRDLEGIRRCVIDAVWKAQGKGCPPYTISVAVGATLDQVSLLGKRLLLKKLNERHLDREIAEFEVRLLEEINSLGIGPLGLGGHTTALSVHLDYAHRHPATFFVEVTLCCWAHRRGRLVWK